MITYKENGKFVYVYKGNDLIVTLIADRTNKENEVIALEYVVGDKADAVAVGKSLKENLKNEK